ncbi:hypothetical protein AB0P12_05470 [Streptomyces subrutilus]|uniref:Secreted protein n=1 Tax=Streptomyces subrutilus TaxID=36818 RepID=A0A5P2ULS3_9ACTN|nr:hypothetical protein [Streptomyces subrutilus]QEU80202.1 hypothetical protein CP968_19500 [Streptomyces subrutilus]WSJ30518.1 hypothetical protein OG479_15135 [Streptomyces subrutilus]GGZ49701.1 hypothetical protein GCM10010371_06310 [Streptomyces subrutilus]
MKLTKVAAVVVGSVAALGATAPAFAADAQAAMPPMSLTSGVTDTLNAVSPVSEHLPETVGAGLAEQNGHINKVVGTVQKVNKVRNDVPGELLGLANGATQASPMLGGVKLNGGNG